MFDKPLPTDADSLQVLLKASQEALNAVGEMRSRSLLAYQTCRDFFAGEVSEGEMSRVFEQLNAAEIEAQAAGIPDRSFLAAYIDKQTIDDLDSVFSTAKATREAASSVAKLPILDDDLAEPWVDIYKDSYEYVLAWADRLCRLLERFRNAVVDAQAAIGKPVWKPKAGELLFEGRLARMVAGDAARLRPLLDLFSLRGWPTILELSDDDWDDQKVRETVSDLNRSLKFIRFRSMNLPRGPGKPRQPRIGWAPISK